MKKIMKTVVLRIFINLNLAAPCVFINNYRINYSLIYDLKGGMERERDPGEDQGLE